MDFIITELAVETKTDIEVFEDFDPKRITVKVSIWEPNAILIVERKAKYIKIPISEAAKFADLYEAIKKVTGLEKPLVIKRNFSRTNPF